LNSALKEVISSVLSIVEFSVEDCVCLQRVLTSLISAATHLFTQTTHDAQTSPHPEAHPQTSTPHHAGSSVQVVLQDSVPVWLRYAELAEFFGLGLGDVVDRWADGKGPLAVQLTAAELSRLVVAVFEKTSRRDALLAQLHSAATAAATGKH